MLHDNMINILKFIGDKRRTTSQIVYEFRLHFSTVRKKLEWMINMNLAERHEYGTSKKRSYEFSLTEKGKAVLKALELK